MRTRLVLVALFALAGRAVADDPHGPAGAPARARAAWLDAADAFLAAHDAGDDAARKGVLRSADPILVAEGLLARGLAEPDRAAAARAAIDALVRDLEAPFSTSVAALAARWDAWGAPEREREAHLLAAWTAMRTARLAGRNADVLREEASVAADVAAATDSVAACLVLQLKGEALRASSRPNEGTEAWEELVLRADRLGWVRGGLLAASFVAHWWRQNHRFDRAEAFYAARIPGLESAGDVVGASILRGHRAEALEELGKIEEALDLARTAAAALEARDQKGFASEARMEEAEALVALGRDEEADAVVVRVRDLIASNVPDETRNVLRVRMAGLAIERGRYAQAWPEYEAILSDPAARDDLEVWADAAVHMATAWSSLGQSDRALALLTTAVERTKKEPQSPAHAATTASLAGTLVEMGRSAEAEPLARDAEAAFRSIGDAKRAEVARVVHASVLEQLGRTEDAEREARDARRALAARKDLPAAAFAGGLEARLRLARGDAQGARQLYDASLAILGAQPELTVRQTLLAGRAAAQLALGRGDDAVRDAREALELADRFPRGLDEESAAMLRRARIAALATALQALRGGEATATVAPAFEVAELARARSLAEHLSVRPGLAALSPELARQHALTLAAVEAGGKRLLASAFGPAADAKAAASARTDLDAAWDARRRLLDRIRAEAPLAAIASGAPALTLEKARATLGADEALLAYTTAGDELYGFCLAPGGATWAPLGPAAPLLERAATYPRLLAAGGSDEAASRALHDALVGPFAASLAGVRRLVVVPDGALAFVPFEALAPEAGQRLVERYEVRYAPSATVLDLLRSSPEARAHGEGAIALGDPVYPGEAALPVPELALRSGLLSLDRLLHTGPEAERVAAAFPSPRTSLLLREHATLAELRSALAPENGRRRVLHLAAHAVANPDVPRLSGVVMGGGETWTADAVSSARVPADLVVLSGCETARGRVAGAEGVLGLVRAFFVAGSPRVVASCWSVSDRGTLAFMDRFYAALAGGRSPSAALHEAKVASLKAGGAEASPASWAAFVLWGLGD